MTETAPVAALPEKEARFLSERPRWKTIDLEWPVSFEGREYRSITLIRLTAGDVSRFQEEIEQLLKNNPDAALRFPIFRDANNAPIPDAVLDALDDDDRFELDRSAADFLPRRFRGIAEPSSGPGAGGNTGPSSES